MRSTSRHRLPIVLFLAVILAPASHADDDNPLGLDTDCIAECILIEGMVSRGEKADAEAHMDALYQKNVVALAEAHAKAADLSLASFNPFDARTADEVAAAMKPLRADIERLTKNVSLVLQSRPDQLEKLGEEVDDSAKAVAKAYTAMTVTETGLTTAQLALFAIHGLDKLPPAEERPYQRLEAASHDKSDDAAQRLRDLVAELRPQLATDPAAADMVHNVPGLLDAFLSTTNDHITGESLLNRALELAPGEATLWARRSILRLGNGNLEGAFHDVRVANALDSDSAEVHTAVLAYQAAPRFAAQLYTEPADDLTLAYAALASGLGAQLKGDADRIAAAARRNYGRSLLACSFILDKEERDAALTWAKARYGDHGTMRCSALHDAAAKVDGDLHDAGGDVKALLEVHNRYAPVLAQEPVFWRLRTELFIALGKRDYATSAVDIATFLAPDADWLADARERIEKL